MTSGSRESPIIAFMLSLIAGVLMLITGILSVLWFMGGGSFSNYFGGQGMMGGLGGMMSGLGGMMSGFESIMHGFGVPYGFMSGLSILGLISGIIVIIGAIMFNVNPVNHLT